jgi:hypothetical protein
MPVSVCRNVGDVEGPLLVIGQFSGRALKYLVSEAVNLQRYAATDYYPRNRHQPMFLPA